MVVDIIIAVGFILVVYLGCAHVSMLFCEILGHEFVRTPLTSLYYVLFVDPLNFICSVFGRITKKGGIK